MTTPVPPAPARTAAPRTRSGLHRAWAVAAVTLLALVAAVAFPSTTGALFAPIEDEFGWSRTQLSGSVTAHLLVYGLVAPFAAVLMERFSMRAVAATALGLVAAGSGLTLIMTRSGISGCCGEVSWV